MHGLNYMQWWMTPIKLDDMNGRLNYNAMQDIQNRIYLALYENLLIKLEHAKWLILTTCYDMVIMLSTQNTRNAHAG